MSSAKPTPTPTPKTVNITFSLDEKTKKPVWTVAPNPLKMAAGKEKGKPAEYSIEWLLTGATFDTNGVVFVADPPKYHNWPGEQPTVDGDTKCSVADHKNTNRGKTKKYKYNINVLYKGNKHFTDDPEADDEGEDPDVIG